MYTQWYWPEEVGAIEANSAIEVITARKPIQDRKNEVINPALPPFVKPEPKYLQCVSW